jgi:hypothetical protein
VSASTSNLLGLTLLFLLINPVPFPEPNEELDDWMYKVVRVEERWTNDGHRLIGPGYPQIYTNKKLHTSRRTDYSAASTVLRTF